MLVALCGLSINVLSHRDARAAMTRFMNHPRAALFPAREKMVKQNLRNTRGRAEFNVGFILIGITAMTRPSTGPMTVTSWVFTLVLLYVAIRGVMLDWMEMQDRRDILKIVRDRRWTAVGSEGDIEVRRVPDTGDRRRKDDHGL